ncbi:MAG: succinate dehydrogenase cytochrome b subunit [Verrucomicrobiota bacterium]
MTVVTRLFTTSIGKKLIMGVTGMALCGFVFIHMIGNTLIFFGQDTINHYAANVLRFIPEALWLFRVGLLTCAILHIWMAISLSIENKKARPKEYLDKKPLTATLASRTMSLTGIVISVFIIFHILHFTTRNVPAISTTLEGESFNDLHADLHGQQVHDVYTMVEKAFQKPWVVGFYIVSMALVAWHLSHGFQSFFQSLGLKGRGYQVIIDHGGTVFAWVIFVGMSSVPIAVITGTHQILFSLIGVGH